MNATLPAVERDVKWQAGTAPVAVVMISLNEGHNMTEVLSNLQGWAQEVFLVDSFSEDDTVAIASSHGVHVVQRRFSGFGEQWNFALTALPITAPWTMKLDPDERVTDDLKSKLHEALQSEDYDGITVSRRWWFMGKPLPIREQILRVWRTGRCRFSDVTVNEHPMVAGKIQHVNGDLEHFDSPDLHHWFEKQNRYSTAEAVNVSTGAAMADIPKPFGTPLQRRMWLKRLLRRLPFRSVVLFLYYWLWKGTWRAGRVGYIAARLWADVWRFREYKRYEIERKGRMLHSSPARIRDRRP
jgi:glycosyltransferase involved in cell wall biosynthesis